jgi:hypothetical protein
MTTGPVPGKPVQEDAEVPKAVHIEPRSGGILIATGVSRWRAGLKDDKRRRCDSLRLSALRG